MLPRFLAESIDVDGRTARLSDEETRHLSQVLRLRAGDEIAVFDGKGMQFQARVERVAREGADLRLLDRLPAADEPAVRITLAQAAIKGDKMDDVVRDATMMGVAAIEPLVTAHTAAHLKPGASPDRWRRIAIASAKQSRRAVVPAIGSGLSVEDWLARDRSERRLLLVEPSAAGQSQSLSELSGAVPASASLMVGPEGGWSAAEIAAARQAGYAPVTLGRRTLRADAVPIVAIGVLQYVWNDL
jgi:16S rRNA (uracil1498-N3)-methyltransferase